MISPSYSRLFFSGGASSAPLLFEQYLKWKQWGRWWESRIPLGRLGGSPEWDDRELCPEAGANPICSLFPWVPGKLDQHPRLVMLCLGRQNLCPCCHQVPPSPCASDFGLWPQLCPVGLWHPPSLSEPEYPPLPSFCDLWWVLLDPATLASGQFGPGLSLPPTTEVLTFLVFLPNSGEGKWQGPRQSQRVCEAVSVVKAGLPPAPTSAGPHAHPLFIASLCRGPEDLRQRWPLLPAESWG